VPTKGDREHDWQAGLAEYLRRGRVAAKKIDPPYKIAIPKNESLHDAVKAVLNSFNPPIPFENIEF